MRSHVFSVLLASAYADAGAPSAAGYGGDCRSCYKPAPKVIEHVLSPRMHEVLTLAELPTSLDWRDKDGHCYSSVLRNQHIPMYCGACWSFAASTALSDRIRIWKGPGSREVNLAMQVILNCDIIDDGCDGGDPLPAYHFIHKAGGLPEESCQPYEAVGHETGQPCTAEKVCRSCDETGCHAVEEYEVYDIEEYGMVYGEAQMIAELQRGPIACQISTPPLFDIFTGESIWTDNTNDTNIDHIITINGYGEENGVKYWVLRNSWGTYWGHYGWMKLIRGVNNILVESGCSWATPANGGYPKLRNAYTLPNASWNEQHEGYVGPTVVPAAAQVDNEPIGGGEEAPVSPEARAGDWEDNADEGGSNNDASRPAVLPRAYAACRTAWSDWAAVGGEKVLSPLPQDTLAASDVPLHWDWRNVSGANYASWNNNERAPHYCASCWAQSVSAALSDRINVQKRNAWPQIALSPQVLVNCVSGSHCSAGDPASAYAYISKNGITDHTCQAWRGLDLACDDSAVCETCAPNNEESVLVWPGTCVAVPNPLLYFVSEYGSVRGAANMKAEIYQRGPIGCGLEATAGFQQYSSGIYSEFTYMSSIDHEVSVAGWGVTEDQTEFWVGRNSWGTYWGEEGWFRLRMHSSNLGIELDCNWGVPEMGPSRPFTAMEGEEL